MPVNFISDVKEPFIANIDWVRHNFTLDKNTGLALPTIMAEVQKETGGLLKSGCHNGDKPARVYTPKFPI